MQKLIKEVLNKQAKSNFGSFASYSRSLGKPTNNGAGFAVGIVEKCLKYLKPLGLFLVKKELVFTHIKRGDEWSEMAILPYDFYDIKHIKDGIYECSMVFPNGETRVLTLKGKYELKEAF